MTLFLFVTMISYYTPHYCTFQSFVYFFHYVIFFPLVMNYARYHADLFPQYFAHCLTHDRNVLWCFLEFICKLNLPCIILMVSTDFYHHIIALSKSNFGMMPLTLLRVLLWKSLKKSLCILEATVYDASCSFAESCLGGCWRASMLLIMKENFQFSSLGKIIFTSNVILFYFVLFSHVINCKYYDEFILPQWCDC